MAILSINLFEALTSVGVAPERARDAERALEQSVEQLVDQRFNAHAQQAFTKADGERVRVDVEKLRVDLLQSMRDLEAKMYKMNLDQVKWIIAIVFASIGAFVALQKWMAI